MQFLTRMLIVLGVLGALGYGSYAFGKYVLSARLFGPQNGSKTAVTASTGTTLEVPPPVKVEVLPADPTPVQSSETPTETARPTATPVDSRVEIVPNSGNNSGTDSGNNTNGNSDRPRRTITQEPTPRPRRKRRPRRTPRPRATSAPRSEAPPARVENARSSDNGDGGGTSSSDNQMPDTAPAPRISPRDNSDNSTPPRRIREPRADIKPRVEPAPRIEPAPRLRPRREESPVPVPEGARRGGDSPVPMPG